MSTVTATASAAGSFTFTTKNTAGQAVTPVSVPVVTWYSDAERTLDAQALTVTGSGYTYTAGWAGNAAPVAGETRYLTIEVETAAGASAVDDTDEILFVGVSASPRVDTGYTTLAAVKADLGITGTDDDKALLRAIAAASRSVDRMTGTTFAPVTETRRFRASRCGRFVRVDRFTDPTGLVVKTGSGGTYTTALVATDYVLAPFNAAASGGAYYRIDAPNAGFHSYLHAAWPEVEITAQWGWHYVPDDVEMATRLKAVHLFHRREAPHGRAGYADDAAASEVVYGPDPDVTGLLAPYIPIGIR